MPVSPGRRIRNPELHREAILAAAAQSFAERGYQQATIRDIARRAGVTHGLVLRHFGSKEQLFLAAVPGTRDVAELGQGPPETLPERLATGYVNRMENAAGGDAFLALVRSAGSDDDSATRLLLAMQERTLDTYRAQLGKAKAEQLLPFIASLLIGVTFSRYIVRAGFLAEMDRETFTEHLTHALRGLIAA
ncbi:TetR/AcrR family transcriptional regulator [Actinocrispum wychmicini]|uniref:TetR family transcriptional regulator n=1 Tax=Actinocrispum wychmicini TaxID=1213861 RepID=A0A4R2JQL5_9PSEU|nr:TetR/AcrR family transcriptional regulator [Actinocrispum wychmicini]TCO62523.1 TetR family transcriptional regulator [Actinocrispum wychmicini]